MSVRVLEKKLQATTGQQLLLPVKIANPTDHAVCLECPCDLPPALYQTFEDRDRKFQSMKIQEQPRLTSLAPGEQIQQDIQIRVPEKPGRYLLMISFGSELLEPGINGRPAKISVTDSPP